MRIALINGSPKASESASGILLTDLKKYILKYESERAEINEISLREPVVSREALEEMKNAEIWIFAFPLYVDGIPAHLLSCLVQLEKYGLQNRPTYIYGIVNCGFYEGIQAETALKILQNWCTKADLVWGGGIGVGGGGALSRMPTIENGHGPKAPIEKALRAMTDNIIQHKIQENSYVSVAFPRCLYKMAAQIGWRQMIHANGGKTKDLSNSQLKKSGKGWKTALVVLVLVLAAFIGGAGVMFREELKIAGSVRPMIEEKNVYYMETDSSYHFEAFLEAGGAASDGEVSAFLTKCISKGFYQVDVTDAGPACSVISALDRDNSHVWGRNFDWDNSVPIIVKCTPKDGYASIATCDFKNITNDSEEVPDNFMDKMLAIAAIYVPMDGVNEAGLCVADLEVNEGGMRTVDTDKPNLTITTAIRLLLNRAATVEEAVAMLGQYDIYASGGISHHLAISDASGTSVSVEFADGEMIVVETDCITNFNLANGDTAAGGESAKERYELLCTAHAEKNGILTGEDVKTALAQVSKTEGEWRTQWSIVYQQDTQTADYYFDAEYTDKVSFLLQK